MFVYDFALSLREIVSIVYLIKGALCGLFIVPMLGSCASVRTAETFVLLFGRTKNLSCCCM
jgi:hypothetical protein